MLKEIGDIGEREVVAMMVCPNCSKDLMLLPSGYPLYDVQCTACNFRAQIKTSRSEPKSTIMGAGWDIVDKVLKSGYLIPPLIAYFKWENKAKIPCYEIRYYPFIPKKNIKKYTLSPTAKRANYRMFSYKDMNDLPYFLVSSSESK